MENGIEYKFIEHAKYKLNFREITMDQIMACLKNPEQVVPAKYGRFAYQSKLPLNGKMHIIRIIVEKKRDCLKVITIYKTSKIKKYWKEG